VIFAKLFNRRLQSMRAVLAGEVAEAVAVEAVVVVAAEDAAAAADRSPQFSADKGPRALTRLLQSTRNPVSGKFT